MEQMEELVCRGKCEGLIGRSSGSAEEWDGS